MINISAVRAKCFCVVQGLERSLKEILVHNYDVDDAEFLTVGEQERALTRLRQDLQELEWSIDDVTTEDLLLYLDVGDLINLLNRNAGKARTIVPSEIRKVTRLLVETGLPAIRNRVMHTIRPLESDDLPTLMSLAGQIPSISQSLNWAPLKEGVRLAQGPELMLNVAIPSYWAEEAKVPHNLPSAEFDDTGFIGRSKERRQLRQLLESDHSVITIVGPGGIGKTALALRVCHDIVDDPEANLDKIVWVSLKTQELTADGIRTISNAVDTEDDLLNSLMSSMNVVVDRDASPMWDRVLEQMKSNRILLVIDNLETLGLKIRELAVGMPRDSKLLLTSRVGLGEIELRYEMPNLSPKDAGKLLRNLGVAYNYTDVARLDHSLVTEYCNKLHHNPLLIKWFVQAMGKGVRPADILSKEDIGDALRFCWENVYLQLSPLSRKIVTILLSARRNLSQTQLQELLATHYVSFVLALQQLHQSNIIERNVGRDGGAVYQVGSLVLDYLGRYHPPNDSFVRKTREQLRAWQIEQERSAVDRRTYRYSHRTIVIETSDQSIAGPHLRNALNAVHSHSSGEANKYLERARELCPQWWEVHRVRAYVLQQENRPIYEVEQAFEDSINCEDTDVNRFHYAVYLMGIGEYERALEQIESGLVHRTAKATSLRSIRGLILLRSGRLSDALIELEYVWNQNDAGVPQGIRRVQGTQLAGGLRRRTEQLYSLGEIEKAEEHVLKGLNVASVTAEHCGWDWKLAEVGIDLLSEVMGRHNMTSPSESKFKEIALSWDQNVKFMTAFGEASRKRKKVRALFERNIAIHGVMPNSTGVIPSPDSTSTRLNTGAVNRVIKNFAFIQTDSPLGDVHMDRSSLANPSEWKNIFVGQRVVFMVTQEDKGPHALGLEIDASV